MDFRCSTGAFPFEYRMSFSPKSFIMINILKGWFNYFFPSAVGEGLVHARMVHCNSCPQAQVRTYAKVIDDEVVQVKGKVCARCLCPLSAKLRSPNSTCPDGRW